MNPSSILCIALVLCGVLSGCAHAPNVHLATPVTSYHGQEFEPPRKLRNGSASLREVYAWANSLLGTNYPLKTIHRCRHGKHPHEWFSAGSWCPAANLPTHRLPAGWPTRFSVFAVVQTPVRGMR